ncbi:MAG: ROK family protein [Bacillota bacterium]
MGGTPCAVGIDLGGTKLSGALVDRQGRILRSARAPTPAKGGPQAVFTAIRRLISSLIDQAGDHEVLGIGLGICGPVDAAAGLSIQSPNLGWAQTPVLEHFRSFGLPLAMENDVRCHAIGELHFGAGRGVRNFILIALGTGIGSGIVLDGRLYGGPKGVAGEIGHIVLEPGGPLCGCGKQGCFEAIASGVAIGRRANEAGLGATARELFELAAAGNGQALRLVDQVAYDLGRGISTYINLMNPQRVILGGGVARAGALLFDPLRRYTEQETMPCIRSTYEILPAELGDEAGVVGAAALVPGLAGTA